MDKGTAEQGSERSEGRGSWGATIPVNGVLCLQLSIYPKARESLDKQKEENNIYIYTYICSWASNFSTFKRSLPWGEWGVCGENSLGSYP